MQALGACFAGVFGFIVWAAVLVYTLVCAWTIAKKAGYEPWYGILMIVPILNLVLLYFFAFTEWPAEKQWKQPKT